MMTEQQRAEVERLKAERAKLQTPLQRILFDNDAENGPIALRVIVATESKP